MGHRRWLHVRSSRIEHFVTRAHQGAAVVIAGGVRGSVRGEHNDDRKTVPRKIIIDVGFVCVGWHV
jgi:hypothetical protein